MSICCEKCGLVRAWAAYFLMALTSMFCFIATVPTPLSQTMGGWPGHKIFNSNGKAGLLAMCQESSAAVEAAAYLFQGLQVYCKGSSTRRQDHLHAHSSTSPHARASSPVQSKYASMSLLHSARSSPKDLSLCLRACRTHSKSTPWQRCAQGSKQEEL